MMNLVFHGCSYYTDYILQQPALCFSLKAFHAKKNSCRSHLDFTFQPRFKGLVKYKPIKNRDNV